MYKVFFKDSCFLLTDECKLLTKENIYPSECIDSSKKGSTVHINGCILPQEDVYTLIYKDFTETKAFINRLLNHERPFTALLYHDDLEALFSVFKSCFLYVKAAGGVVEQEGQILVIKRLGIYDLPKGHLEACETIEACAIREVEEECGLQQVAITAPLAPTYHIYFRNECWHLKKTYWYRMSCPLHPVLTPQTEEDIKEVFWLPVSSIDKVLENTYPSLKPIFLEVKNAGHE